ENGLDFLPILESLCREKGVAKPPVLVCSAFDDPFRMETARKLGAQGYAPKSGSHEDLLNAVDAVLRGETVGPNEGAGRYADLTMRELEILDLVKRNKTYQQIADTLFISRRTVETHVASIFRKTGTSRRSELMSL
ncbi:MAG: response regulator transcription factor, partial [Treponema sp.]|nr:response regulator transcription factor [Treponema sp.]